MNTKLMKLFSSCAMAAFLSFTSVAAQAVESVGTDYADTLSISGCATNIKNTYKERYPEHSELIDCIVDSIISDNEFIEYFETKGSVAFQIVSDTLDDSLEPKVSLYGFGNESYYSTYSSYPCKQLYSYYDGPAAVVMALMGSGCIDYTQNKSALESYQKKAASELGTDLTHTTSPYDITDYMQEKYVEKFGQNAGHSFKTKVFNSSNADRILDNIRTSLAWDTEPIIRIPDRSVLYNHKNETGMLYITVHTADDQGQYIVYTDPALDNASGKSLSYDELEALTVSGTVLMSSFS